MKTQTSPYCCMLCGKCEPSHTEACVQARSCEHENTYHIEPELQKVYGTTAPSGPVCLDCGAEIDDDGEPVALYAGWPGGECGCSLYEYHVVCRALDEGVAHCDDCGDAMCPTDYKTDGGRCWWCQQLPSEDTDCAA